ncbi:MAG: hypothetical protein ACXWFZ_13230, partial [Nitrososphaeraceae archaeon]
MKFEYKYIIYKIYSWSAKKKGEVPVTNTILTLSVIHFFHLLTVIVFIDRIIVPLDWTKNINVSYLFVGAIIYFYLFY